MRELRIIKHLINSIFFGFIPLGLGLIIYPYLHAKSGGYAQGESLFLHSLYPAIHCLAIFCILFCVRKFVQESYIGDHFQASSRKYLKFSGIFCLVYCVIKLPETFAFYTFYKVAGSMEPFQWMTSIFEVGSLCMMMLIGLFLIYLSKVFELSYQIKEENDLTI